MSFVFFSRSWFWWIMVLPNSVFRWKSAVFHYLYENILNFKIDFLVFKHCIFNLYGLSEHISHLCVEYGGGGNSLGTTFQLRRLFMKKINVDFYLDVSVFRTAEIWSIHVHWAHPARLCWTRRLQNKIWIQNQQSLYSDFLFFK